MKKRLLSGFLAFALVLQALVPSIAYANKNDIEDKPSDSNLITIGKLSREDYPEIDPATLLRVAKEERNKINGKGMERGATLFSTKSPYINGQQPADSEKPKYWANVMGELKTTGIDGTPFDWDKVLGQGAKVKLLFTQTNGNVMTGVRFYLEVDSAGKYYWKNSDGKPTYLPLYDADGNPYTYNVQIERNFSENVQLIIQESNGTPKAKFRQEGDKQVATISFLDIEIQQIASTKFVSQWHTSVDEEDRPQIEGYFEADTDVDNDFNFPKNDTTRTILRSSFVENFEEDEDNGPWSFLSSEIETTPKTVEVKTNTQGLTFKEEDGVKTVKSGDHKFKYDFTYDVINGGKLTMTEVIPVTFDANGGKFKNFTAPDTETKIVKEVDYESDLTEKAEDPKREGKTFKGWSTTADGKTPATDDDFKNITEKKTLYAIWSDEDIQVEELKTTESLITFRKNGTQNITNDFVPTLEDLKGQVKVKDANGDFVELPNDVKFSIVDGTNEYTEDSVDLKKFIYEKVKENNKDEVSRKETIEAKIKYSDGTTREIEIPIMVLKNIYKGTDNGNKYPHIPDDYVKVTIDPTDKAQDPAKTYYYVNPKAKVIVPRKTDPVGTGDNKFSKWTIKSDSAIGADTDYKFGMRQIYEEDSTITAQYGTGKIKIIYVDQNGNEIDKKYQIAGQDYPSEKSGGLGGEANDVDFATKGPDFKGYVFNTRDSIKGKKYKDPADPDKLDTVTYKYNKKVTTTKPKYENNYFKVIFDANGGEFGKVPKNQKTVYVLYNGNDATVEKVTFDEVREAVEETFGKPTKDKAEFKEWQEKAADGTKIADNYEIKCPKWDWETYPDDGYAPEVFYAHYGKASAKIAYLDLDGKPIADKFKIDTEKYPTEKEGTAGEAIANDVYTKDNAPKFIGYKFNRIELNPANSKYALKDKATIKIYYEKLPDVVPEKDGSGNPNEKPDGYVTVKFLPGDNGTLTGITKYYVNPKADPAKTMADITKPTIKANQGFKVDDPKWKDANDDALDNVTEITKDLTYTAQYETLNDIIKDLTPEDNSDKPDGYVTVVFKPGDHGKLDNDTKDVVYYVNPKADPVKKNSDLTEPSITADTDYEVKEGAEKWSPEFNGETKIKADATYTAQYKFTKDFVPQGPGEDKPVVPDNYVKVTFKEGDHGIISASQTTIYWVNPKVEVDLTEKAPTVKADPEYKHNGWDKKLKATFSENTEITAKYLKKVLTEEPTKDADKYVKVDFKAETHGEIKDGETSVYWVLKDETVELKTPVVEANVNYAFKEWKEPVQTSYSKDKTHNAVFVYTGKDVVPQPGTDKPDVPDNFVKVVFAQGEHGTIATGATTTYWVNPKAKVTVTAPTVTAKEEYKHVAWTYGTKEETNLQSVTDTFTAKETIITAKYLKNVLTQEPKEDRKAYVEVKFNAEKNGKFEDGATTTYWVLKDTPVDITAPSVTANDNYKFIEWKPAVQDSYSKDTEHKAQYKKIIETVDPKDKDYVKVTFDPSDQGTIKEGSNAEVWVLKDETINPKDITPDLEVKEKYAFEKWDPAVQTSYNVDTTHKATYKYNGDNVVPQEPGQDKPNVPKDFVKVTFVAGDNGIIANTETTIYWVNPEKEVTLDAPKITANEDYKHVAWTYESKEEVNLQSVTDTFASETTITAKYLKKVLTEDPKDKENYVKVTFDKGTNGTIESTETTTYWVLKNTDVTIKAPSVTANKGYTFTEWNPAVKTKYDTDTTHTAQYKAKDRVVTEDPYDTDYIKVIFNANGGTFGTETTKDLWVLNGIATFADAKAKVATPTKEKATFKEWQTAETDGEKVVNNKVLTIADEIFYAAWINEVEKIIFEASKVWVDGPSKDHTAVDLKLYRQVEGGQKEEVTGVTPGKSRDVNDVNKFNYAWKDLPKTNEEGNEYKYTVEEAGVTNNKVKVGDNTYKVTQEGNTITNTYEVSQTENNVIGKKIWSGVPDGTKTPTVKLELWRKTSANTQGEKVKDAMALTNNQADFGKQDKTDKKGNEYTYFVKEVFDDANEKVNWTVSGEGTLEITNTYKTKPAPITYTVSFDNKGHGTKPEDQTVKAREKATEPEALSAEGFDFGGWYTDENFKYLYDFTRPVNSDITLYAKWTEKTVEKFTIKYISMDTNMGTVSNAQDEGLVTTGTIKGSTAKANEGYKFVKWIDTDGNSYTDETITPTEKKNATYIAVFEKEEKVTPEPKEFTIKYISTNKDYGTVNPSSETVEIKGGTINGSTATAKDGYKFVKWIDTEGKLVSTDAKLVPTERKEATYIAVFEKTNTVIVVPGPSNPTDEKDPNKPDGGRVGGNDRTDTAIEISKKYYGQADTVIVVDRKDFPDAMTASVLSKLLNAPILLTETNRLDPRVAAEIQRLGARDVIIVGGNSSVSEAVKKELAKFDKDEVERIYGRDRYETSAQVARRVVGITGKIGHGVVASGEVFADALTVAPFAAREGYPILLVKRNSVPPTINKAIKDLSITKVTIAGGYSTVAKSLESSLPTVVERLRGNSRYETAIDIVNKKFNNANEIFLANGEQWMDALVIGPVGGILDIPILLTGANNAPQSLKDYIAKSKIEKITAIGGRSMVSDKVLSELSK